MPVAQDPAAATDQKAVAEMAAWESSASLAWAIPVRPAAPVTRDETPPAAVAVVAGADPGFPAIAAVTAPPVQTV
jgi:hypothetical protein